MPQKQIKLSRLEQTKGAVKFGQLADDGAPLPYNQGQVGTVYFRKEFLGEPYPQELTITVEW